MDIHTLLHVDGVITHPEPDILGCEVKWALFRMDWLDLLVVEGTLKSLLQHH